MELINMKTGRICHYPSLTQTLITPKLQPPKLVLVETANLCTASTKARPP